MLHLAVIAESFAVIRDDNDRRGTRRLLFERLTRRPSC